MTKLFLLPGGLIHGAVGLAEDSDNTDPADVPEHADLGHGRSDHDLAFHLNPLRSACKGANDGNNGCRRIDEFDPSVGEAMMSPQLRGG